MLFLANSTIHFSSFGQHCIIALTDLSPEGDQHGEELLVVPNDYAATQQLHLVQHALLNGHGGHVLPAPGDQQLLDATSDEEIP